ncbi:MAG TPA: cytochrome P450 [Verrucomicrobiae bacterium]|nr:cytochrome P450 [Verrucomicrobiae bacterium]
MDSSPRVAPAARTGSGADRRNGHGPTPVELGYDPWDPAFIADPYPALARLRDRAPIAYDERTNQWLVSRHADVNALLRDRRLGRSYLHVASHEAWGRTPPPADQAAFWDLLAVQMIDLEPPDHTRLRRLVTKAFTPRTIEALRPRIEDIVGIVVEHARGLGAFDLIADLLELVPVTVIAELLGIPESDRHLLRPWSADMTLMFELNPTDEMQRRATDASAAFGAYLRDLARDRRRRPGDDLISELAAVVEAGGDRLTEDELIGTAVLLLNAGHEASVNGAANSWWALFRHPDTLAALRADPSLVPTAIEELLRYDTPAPMFERWVLEDVEIGGVTIPRGQELALQFAAANRDPAVFARADEVVLDRSPNPYLSFGAGIHYCLGAPLAKVEFDILFRRMVADLPTMELVVEPRWKPRFILRGLDALPVRL